MKLSSKVVGEGAPILMIHGIIGDKNFFDKAAELLSTDYKVITYDRRGYGESDAPEDGDYSVSTQADDAAKLLKEYVNEPAWIVGNSAGGLITIELAIKYPELVKGMILLEPSLTFDEESKEIIRGWNSELNGYVQEKKIKKALPAFSRVIGNESQNDGTPQMSMAEMKRVYKNLSTFMLGELNEVQHYNPSIESVKGIACPKCVWVTKSGINSIFARTSISGAKILDWPVSYVPGYHNYIKDNPDSFLEEFGKFVEKNLLD